MASMADLVSRVRLELGDLPKEFTFTADGDGVLKDFYLNMEWIERMDVTVAKDQLTIKGLENKQGEELSKELIDNDFKREG